MGWACVAATELSIVPSTASSVLVQAPSQPKSLETLE
jgi:hypothetical protein